MLKLVIEDDEGRKTVVPFVREEITIGRQEGNTIRLTERNVSRRHARLLRHNGSVVVEDLGSYNGIRINGERIRGQVPLTEGDLIQIGDYDLAVQDDAQQSAPPPAPVESEADREDTAPTPPKLNGAGHAAQTLPAVPVSPAFVAEPEPIPQHETLSETVPEPEDTSPEEPSPASAQGPELARRQSTAVIKVDQVEANRSRRLIDLDAKDAPRLVLLNTEIAGREFACIRSELKIGRTEDNDISIDHRSLSRTHAKLVREDSGEWRVIDLQSANGLSINGEPYAQVTLRSGDVIELGHVKLKFVGAGEHYQFPGKDGGAKKTGLTTLFGAFALLAVAGGGGALWYLKVWRELPHGDDPSLPAAVAEKPAADTESLRPPEPTLEEKLAAARAAIDEADFGKAAALLQTCSRSDGTLEPQAAGLLTQLKSEEELREILESAEKALAAGDLEKADGLLTEGARTQLLESRHALLRAKWKTAQDQQKSALAQAAPKAREPGRTPAHKAGTGSQEAQKLYEEGLLLIRSKQAREARLTLEKCVRADPQFAQCHKALGGVNARLGDAEKGAHHYRKFLQLAPEDKDADKVRNILETYEGMKR